jgi:hypothetical protein
VGSCGLNSCNLGYGSMVGTFIYSNEPSGSIKGGEFLDCVSDYQLFEKNSSLWS